MTAYFPFLSVRLFFFFFVPRFHVQLLLFCFRFACIVQKSESDLREVKHRLKKAVHRRDEELRVSNDEKHDLRRQNAVFKDRLDNIGGKAQAQLQKLRPIHSSYSDSDLSPRSRHPNSDLVCDLFLFFFFGASLVRSVLFFTS